MEGKIIIKPSDVGLKDLEVFYNPELLLIDVDGYSVSNGVLFKKTLITGAVVLALNCSPENMNANTVKILNSQPETSFVNNLVNNVEIEAKKLIEEIEFVGKENKQTFFTEEEINEMEILDAYYKEVKNYYPKKNKISF